MPQPPLAISPVKFLPDLIISHLGHLNGYNIQNFAISLEKNFWGLKKPLILFTLCNQIVIISRDLVSR